MLVYHMPLFFEIPILTLPETNYCWWKKSPVEVGSFWWPAVPAVCFTMLLRWGGFGVGPMLTFLAHMVDATLGGGRKLVE